LPFQYVYGDVFSMISVSMVEPEHTCSMQRAPLAAVVQPETGDVWPIVFASRMPSRSERCWAAVVKNEFEFTSSQRSKPWFG
jgi:hypothetical protein